MNYNQQAAWDNANSQCSQMWASSASDQSWTSTLATIVDEYENAFVASLLYDEQSAYDITFGGLLGAHIGYSGTKADTGQDWDFKYF